MFRVYSKGGSYIILEYLYIASYLSPEHAAPAGIYISFGFEDHVFDVTASGTFWLWSIFFLADMWFHEML